jgi:hypothetical protein
MQGEKFRGERRMAGVEFGTLLRSNSVPRKSAGYVNLLKQVPNGHR